MPIQTYAKRYLPQPLVDVLRVMKYRLDLATYHKRTVTHTYGGHRLDMTIADRVAGEWYDKDWPLPVEIAFLGTERVPPAGRVFDLGAHQCLIAMLLARELVPEGSVIAIEANRHNAEVARRNLDLNGVDNVEVMHALISNQPGQGFADMTFNSRARKPVEGVAISMVDALTIDELAERKGWPDVVYMDIEGYEMEALKGAPRTLTRWCHWFIELHGDEALSRYGARNADVLQYFAFQDFARFICMPEEDKFRPVTEQEMPPSERCFMVFAPRAARLMHQDTTNGYASSQ